MRGDKDGVKKNTSLENTETSTEKDFSERDCLTEEKIKKRLSGRESEYLMFIDD